MKTPLSGDSFNSIFALTSFDIMMVEVPLPSRSCISSL
jgi:hypothetical protein